MQPSVRSDGSDGNGAAARVRRELDAHRRSIGESDLRRMFAEDPDRTRWATVEAAGLLVDFSKHLVVPETVEFLTNLADAVGLPTARDALLTGAVVNRTEGRPALHTALRLPAGLRLDVAGEDVAADVHATLSRMGEFTDAVRSGSWRGADGRRVRTVVNIGIGGSDLGPRMAVRALRRRAVGGPEVRFIANVDGADSERALAGLDPGETLFVVCSKTFRTSETLLNARSARAWVIDALGPGAVGRHFAAASADVGAAVEFGIEPECVFGFREWVGGRYSLPSAVGLALMLAIGREAFGEMLAGFHAMDRHFAEAPLAANAPVIHGLLTVWYSGWFGAASTAVVPYAADLDRFPAYLQQLVMESNGKRVTERGDPVADPTAPVTWGEPGTDAQHSFFQLLHQGTRFVPVDLIGVARPAHDLADHHSALLANLLAQSHALAFGRTAAELADDGFGPEAAIHREVPGNRPHTVILGRELSPGFLGALVAFYEHSVFTQAVVWGIDPFDQFGVELGKGIADVVRARLDGAESDGVESEGVDAANERLIAFVRAEGFSAGS